MLKPTERGPFSSVMLPEPIIANPNVFLPGQNAGFLGRRWDPEIRKCDPAAPDFRIESLTLPEQVTPDRLGSRDRLLAGLNASRRIESPAAADYERLCRDALGLLLTGTARGAFALDKEPPALRDRYGRGKWAQSVLLARRLIEAGVRMVFVNWPREPGDLSAGNPLWDTHAHNDARMRDVLCPQFDQGFTALIEDLEDRVLPQELTATILHLLGIGHEATFPDATGRPLRAVEGEPVEALLP